MDLRENSDAISNQTLQSISPIKREQGIETAKNIKAVTYLECSALTQEGLKQV